MATTPSDSCSNCLYFKRKDDVQGICRRYPPTVMNAAMTPTKAGEYFQTYWVKVLSNDWCGEYQLAK